ncbi:MAG: FkbM family methyltransferase [Bacteroidia bacterium]|nr:FkbM family methyltransferase [Bacteroidia bacterium]
MKKAIQAILQRVLGFERYLFVFSLFKIRTLRWDGKNKEGDFNFFLGMLKPDDVVLDIGANIGIMTALMAQKCRTGRVYAFEPVPDNFQAMRRVVNYLHLKNVSLHPVALGPEKGEVEIKMPVIKGVKMQGLSYIRHETIAGYPVGHISYRVPQVALDEWAFDPEERVTAIKMDVENYEQFVLQGARQLLRKHRPVIYCELWDNENRKNCMQILQEAGYLPRVLVADTLVAFQPGIHPHHNFFFFPESNVL